MQKKTKANLAMRKKEGVKGYVNQQIPMKKIGKKGKVPERRGNAEKEFMTAMR